MGTALSSGVLLGRDIQNPHWEMAKSKTKIQGTSRVRGWEISSTGTTGSKRCFSFTFGFSRIPTTFSKPISKPNQRKISPENGKMQFQ
ncbi:hypothetical protein NPIL_479211 [Nephila pilipes]|uniref:Uncharacterized protein n=1 Tax=Nephila pilipes TaxID=299642 RepID=A0A8X6Q8I3_NEPPI|nr:hypothetical protein NPIL_479211 [Nephila pilipes]